MYKTLQQRLKTQELEKAVTNTLKSERKRRSNISKRVKKMIEQKHAYFMTFTLSDKHINKKQDTHVRKIKEALSHASTIDWVFNNDYGDQTERLHYHAVTCTPLQLDYTKIIQIYKYGAVNIKEITKKDVKSISEYLQKLSNHALKKSVIKIWRKQNPKYPRTEEFKL
jgi:hypothetical protein